MAKTGKKYLIADSPDDEMEVVLYMANVKLKTSRTTGEAHNVLGLGWPGLSPLSTGPWAGPAPQALTFIERAGPAPPIPHHLSFIDKAWASPPP